MVDARDEVAGAAHDHAGERLCGGQVRRRRRVEREDEIQ